MLLCVVVCKRGGEVSLQLYCVRRYTGGGGWYSMYVSVGIYGCMSWGGAGAIVT